MDHLKAMQCFVRAVELGSLSAAARELALTQPTASKQVAALEKHVGARLLTRSTTTLALTEAGKRFYPKARGVLEEYAAALADVRDQAETAVGVLRVNAPVSLGVLRLNALLLAFMQQHPRIEVELVLNDRFIDLTEENVDIALRLGGQPPGNAIARHIADSPRWLVAAPTYLHAAPPLQTPADLLQGQQWLRNAWLSAGDLQLLGPAQQRMAIPASAHYRSNSSLALRDAMLHGAGLCLTPAWLVQDLLDEGRLMRVLPEWNGQPQPAWLVYPQRRYQPLRARLLLDYLARALVALPGFSAPL